MGHIPKRKLNLEGGESFSTDKHVEIHTESLAFFSSQPINTAEHKIYWTSYKPTFITKGDSQTSVSFHIEGNSMQYIDLKKSELKVKLKVVDENGNLFDKHE